MSSDDGSVESLPVVVRVPDDEEVELVLEDEEAEADVLEAQEVEEEAQPQQLQPPADELLLGEARETVAEGEESEMNRRVEEVEEVVNEQEEMVDALAKSATRESAAEGEESEKNRRVEEVEDGEEAVEEQEEMVDALAKPETRESAAEGEGAVGEREEMADALAKPAEPAAADEIIMLDSDDDERKEDEEMEEEDDDDLFIIDEDEDGPAINESILETLREHKERAEKFFDPESPTHVANLDSETRQHMAKYAASIFEWFCCMPSPDMLDVVPVFADIDVPFPVTPNIKRALVRRDLGQRLTDVWRQTKDPEKLANHFKIRVNIAVLSLLDFAFANPSYELDIVPLIRMQFIDKTDYWRVAAFILENCNPLIWKEPEELIVDTLNTPICASVMLYLMSAECIRGTLVSIPWKETERNFETLPPDVRASLDDQLKEALKAMQVDSTYKEEQKEMNELMRQFEKENADLHIMGVKLKAQINADVKAIKELETKYGIVKEERRAHIVSIKPTNFEEQGVKLKQTEEEIVVMETRETAQFTNRWLYKNELEVERGARVLARRKEDASEHFEEATLVESEDPDTGCALVEFASEPGKPVSLPIRSIAIYAPIKPKLPAMADGIRVVARVRHPLRAREPPAFYSGTIFSKYDIRKEEYAVALDDFFDEYINVRDMHIMLAQSFSVPQEGQPARVDKRYSYLLVTPNGSSPAQSMERKVFMLYFLAKFPDWTLVRMPSNAGTNVATIHRDGRSCVARTLQVDRQMVWLRFDPMQAGFDSAERGCLAFPCKDATHEHHDEKMYRGSTRLMQQRQNCGFDRTMEAFKAVVDTAQPKELHQLVIAKMSEKVATRHEMRRMQRMNHGMFEPAVPAESKVERAKMTQTARKRGTGLMELEPAARSANRTAKRELKKTIRHHYVEPLDFSQTPLHSPCSHECLKGKDADAMDDRFTHDAISPYFIPIMCGWRRIKQTMRWAPNQDLQQNKPIEGCIHYRAPCGRPLMNMEAITAYLRETRSELTVDLFTFSYYLDETAYVWVDPKFIKMDDIAAGAEGREIPAVNFVDNESPPSFIYRQRRYPLNKKMADTMGMSTGNHFCSGCDCTDDCSDWTKCACQRLTHRESVRTKHSFNKVTKGYTNRLLPERFGSGLYECNENCGCSRKRCINRVVQNELKIPMQMVKTYAMGWGVRSLVDIPKGTFISCYHGAVLSDDIGEVYGEGDEYYADVDFYDLAETEKGNAGVDVVDQGVFFEDVGLRDLTPDEVDAIEKDDELKKVKRFHEWVQRKIRQQDLAIARKERKREREQKAIERKAARERMRGGAEPKEEDEANHTRDEGEEEKEEEKKEEEKKEEKEEEKNEGEKERKDEDMEDGEPKEEAHMVVAKEENAEEMKELKELNEMVERKEESEEKNEEEEKDEMEEDEEKEKKEEDEGVDEEEQAGEEAEGDEEVDEGVEEGESASDEEEDEEEAHSPTVSVTPSTSSPSHSPSPDEEKNEQRKNMEEERVLRMSERRMEIDRRKEEKERQMQKLKKDREEAAKRWTIPIVDDRGRNRFTHYFEEADVDSLFLLDAKTGGNIGRQYNHSCDPNMYTQHIFVDTHDIRLPWVAFFAKRDIKAGEELVWDYGWNPNDDNPRGLKCQCGAENCRIDLL